MVSAAVEKHIKAKAEDAYSNNKSIYSNPYANIKGKEECVELWNKFYRAQFDAEYNAAYNASFGDQPIEQPQEVLDIIEANNQSTLRDMMIYRYTKIVYSRNEYMYRWNVVDTVPNFSTMTDEELFDDYDKLRFRSSAPQG